MQDDDEGFNMQRFDERRDPEVYFAIHSKILKVYQSHDMSMQLVKFLFMLTYQDEEVLQTWLQLITTNSQLSNFKQSSIGEEMYQCLVEYDSLVEHPVRDKSTFLNAFMLERISLFSQMMKPDSDPAVVKSKPILNGTESRFRKIEITTRKMNKDGLVAFIKNRTGNIQYGPIVNPATLADSLVELPHIMCLHYVIKDSQLQYANSRNLVKFISSTFGPFLKYLGETPSENLQVAAYDLVHDERNYGHQTFHFCIRMSDPGHMFGMFTLSCNTLCRLFLEWNQNNRTSKNLSLFTAFLKSHESDPSLRLHKLIGNIVNCVNFCVVEAQDQIYERKAQPGFDDCIAPYFRVLCMVYNTTPSVYLAINLLTDESKLEGKYTEINPIPVSRIYSKVTDLYAIYNLCVKDPSSGKGNSLSDGEKAKLVQTYNKKHLKSLEIYFKKSSRIQPYEHDNMSTEIPYSEFDQDQKESSQFALADTVFALGVSLNTEYTKSNDLIIASGEYEDSIFDLLKTTLKPTSLNAKRKNAKLVTEDQSAKKRVKHSVNISKKKEVEEGI